MTSPEKEQAIMKSSIPESSPDIVGSVPTSGPSITSVFKETEAELLYVEQYVPTAGDNIHIYWSGCNFYFGARGAYAGIQHQNSNLIGDQVFTYNNICSIWDLATDPENAEVTLDYGLPGLHSGHFGGEGTGLHTSHPMPWHLNQWYGMVIRRWSKPDESVTRMAMFMYSYMDGKWTHYMSASVPGANLPLTGTTITGFLERFNGDALGYHGYYGQHYRMDNSGNWHKPDYYEATAGGNPDTWNAMLAYADTNIELIAGGSYGNTQTSIRLQPDQWDPKPKPANPEPSVTSIHAQYDNAGGNLSVQWTIDDTCPPQLSHVINVRSTPSLVLVAANHDARPEQRDTRFQTGILDGGFYVATLIITDIFNQTSAPAPVFFEVN
ncbi:Uncharacterized protein ALO59_04338 [Pseudomonas amygdali pv. mellea]|uniref:DUF3472 domain-containing protein n=1 Tax=Pseudomonas syringae group TaxID=136849 RepID=UPI0006E6B797|nr:MULTISPECIES: DUF3472 domain-containing protein [Pseudomonas syringae group]KPW43818.1 Uncharacterized protein ALO51_02352 [Pseudomonas amygdali]KPX84438.1 Uncharacterized protein ALO59_04338 [Pseudomonas amygdali pv. mellea]MDU8542750.1 DUF3472 domain-containing protein [Pseudomonas syringae group sp. J248-6]